jgi:predicted DNA-binding protein (UPF0251 family)
MSLRLKRIRKVLNPPIIKGMKPYGHTSDSINQSLVTLLYEEYEALRMCDYDMITHHQASELMQVSRPTFTRIYATARQKIAQSLVEGRPIAIEGGKVYFDSDWYQCEDCKCYFNNPEKDKEVEECPLCGHSKVSRCDFDNTIESDKVIEAQDICVCNQCGFEQHHQFGKPCKEEQCPKCNHLMIRKKR